MPQNVTQSMNDYRECARNIWNSNLIKYVSVSNQYDIIDQFDEICLVLFSIMILSPLGKNEWDKPKANKKTPNPLPFLRIIPFVEDGVPIQINRNVECSGYWDHPVDFVLPNEVELYFIDFFDFDMSGFRDFEYCRVKIVKAGNADLVGRDALIKSSYVIVELSE